MQLNYTNLHLNNVRPHTHTHTHVMCSTLRLHVRVYELICGRVLADLGLTLLQQGLQSLLGGSALVVVAHDQDDVIPPELPHQVEPHLCLVGVWRHRPQERQVDALHERRWRRLTQQVLTLL